MTYLMSFTCLCAILAQLEAKNVSARLIVAFCFDTATNNRRSNQPFLNRQLGRTILKLKYFFLLNFA